MAGLTPKQEAFARGLASGAGQAEAYRKAYPRAKTWQPSTVYETASRLAKNHKILARVAELRAPIEAEIREIAKIDADQRIRRYTELGKKAEDTGDIATAIRAEDSITRVTGLFTAERQNNRSPIEDLDPGQRDALRRVIEAALEDAEKDAAKARDEA